MGRLTESAAERLIAARAFTSGPPGFVGAALDLTGPAASPRRALRHGFMVTRATGVVTVSGPPSPGLESCLTRMADDLATVPGFRPAGGAAIRVGLEAGLDGGGPLGLARRWNLAHTLAPVLAAAFANSPSAGWRSVRAARHAGRPVLPGTTEAAPASPGKGTIRPPEAAAHRAGRVRAGALDPCTADLAGIDPRWDRAGAAPEPRAGWAAYVMDAGDRSLRDRLRSDDPPGEDELWRHLDGLRPPVRATGHLELDCADAPDGDGWRVAVAVIATLLDDPVAATAAEAATARFAYGERVWERAARDALTDAELAAAARECFVAAYAALARRGAPRELRDAVAAFTERYVMRGRCPADDRVGAGRPRPIEAG